MDVLLINEFFFLKCSFTLFRANEMTSWKMEYVDSGVCWNFNFGYLIIGGTDRWH